MHEWISYLYMLLLKTMIFTVVCLYISVNMSYSVCINRLQFFFSFYFLRKLVYIVVQLGVQVWSILWPGLLFKWNWGLNWNETKLISRSLYSTMYNTTTANHYYTLFGINYSFQVMHDMSCQKPHDNNYWMHWQLNSGPFFTFLLFLFPCHKCISSTFTAWQYYHIVTTMTYI